MMLKVFLRILGALFFSSRLSREITRRQFHRRDLRGLRGGIAAKERRGGEADLKRRGLKEIEEKITAACRGMVKVLLIARH